MTKFSRSLAITLASLSVAALASCTIKESDEEPVDTSRGGSESSEGGGAGDDGTAGSSGDAGSGLVAGSAGADNGGTAGGNGDAGSGQAGSNGDAGSGQAAGNAGTENAAGTAGSTGDAGAQNVAGAGGEDCGDVTASGLCTDDVLSYCLDGELVEVDCTTIGAVCGASSSGATCIDALDRALACGEVSELGQCNGAVIEYCDNSGSIGVLRTINCAAYGQLCDPTAAADGGAVCVPQGECPSDITEDGSCDENTLSFCEGENLYSFDCGLDECRTVEGFADCFMADIMTGCEAETAAGRCDASTRIACLGNTIVEEDCSLVGLECSVVEGVAACRTGETCPADCPTGYACTAGRCAPTTSPERDWTIAVYMVGDNNLTDAAWADLNEMETVGTTDSVAIVAEVEFSDTFSQEVPTSYRTGAYRLEVGSDDDTADVSSLADATELGTSHNMSDPDSLASFLSWAAETYPAKNLALVMWNHGAAYRGGFTDQGVDNALLDLEEIVRGIRDSGVHPSIVNFDACLMASHEVALSMRGVTDFITVSEEIEPGAGYPYDQVLSTLSEDTTVSPAELGAIIADEYTAYFDEGLRARSVTQSVIDLSQIGAVNDRLAEFAGTLMTELPTNRVALRTALADQDVLRFRMNDMADMRLAMQAIGTVSGTIGTAATAFDTWLSESSLISHSRATGTMSTATGLSLYVPIAAATGYDAAGFETYRTVTDFLPLQAWHAALANLQSGLGEEEEEIPGAEAVDAFSVLLTWGNTPDGGTSGADLDLYVYEPNGDFAVPVNGSVSENGTLSGDSYDTGVSAESYDLAPTHEAGTYIVLVHYYDSDPTGQQAYPRLQLIRSDLPGGSRTFVRGKMVDRVLTEFPMDNSAPLTDVIDENNFQQVLNLDFTNIWYAFSVEVKQ